MGTIEGGGRRRVAPVRSFLAEDIQFSACDEHGARIILTARSGRVTVYESDELPLSPPAVQGVVQSDGVWGSGRQTRLWEDPAWVSEAPSKATPPGSATSQSPEPLQEGLTCDDDVAVVPGSRSSARAKASRRQRPSANSPATSPPSPRTRSRSSAPSPSTSRKKAGRSTTKTR